MTDEKLIALIGDEVEARLSRLLGIAPRLDELERRLGDLKASVERQAASIER